MEKNNNGFKIKVSEWRGEITQVLKDISQRMKEGQERSQKFECEIREKIEKIDQRLTRLETAFSIKSGTWGMIGGLLPALVVFLWWIVNK